MYGYVYKIQCKINNNIFIGATKNFKSTKENAIYLLANGRYGNISLQQDCEKYGIKQFEIKVLDIADSEEEMKLKKQDHISKFQFFGSTLYNHQNIN